MMPFELACSEFAGCSSFGGDGTEFTGWDRVRECERMRERRRERTRELYSPLLDLHQEVTRSLSAEQG